MSKRLIIILTLAFVVGIAFAAYAEVQNVKVSGDMTFMGIARNGFDLANGPAGDKKNDNESNLLSQIRVKIDADLTDNVSAVVRLINERSWTTEEQNQDVSGGPVTTNIDLDLAYVTMKEFLYSPLTLTVGRQELKYGNGLIIAKANNYDTNVLGGVPSDLSKRRAFDAIKAVLNYDPLVIDLIGAKIEKEDPVRNWDEQLLGINAAYNINKKTSAEAYFFNKQERNKNGINDKADQVYTIGGLLSAEPLANLKSSLEVAYQFGTYNPGAITTLSTDRSAMAIQAGANYAIPFQKTKKWSPSISAKYTYLSGTKNSDTQHAWDPMFYEQQFNNIVYAIVPFTNLQVINLSGKMKPVKDVILMLDYGYYNRAQKDTTSMIAPGVNSANSSYGTYTMTDKKFLGQELDLTATYDYTEDVQFGLTAGWFKPGNAFSKDTNPTTSHDATQLIGSMKVTF